jgi:hypothetical protein
MSTGRPIALALMMLAVAVGSASGHAPSPTGSTPAKLIAKLPGAGTFVTDGGRYAFIERRSGLALYDGKTERWRRLDTTCGASDGSRGTFLLACRPSPGAGATYQLFHARSGTLVPVDGLAREDELLHVGRHWLQGTTYADGSYVTLFVNRTTGERRTYPRARGTDRPRDLDDSDLAAAVPHRRPGRILYFEAPFAIQYLPRTVLFEGGAREAVLSRCRRPWLCYPAVQLGEGRVTWAEEKFNCDRGYADHEDCFKIGAYRASDGRRAHWRIDGVESGCNIPGCQLDLAHTRYAVLIKVVTGFKTYRDKPAGTYLYAAPWPPRDP